MVLSVCRIELLFPSLPLQSVCEAYLPSNSLQRGVGLVHLVGSWREAFCDADVLLTEKPPVPMYMTAHWTRLRISLPAR
jgi:hypothetical protein